MCSSDELKRQVGGERLEIVAESQDLKKVTLIIEKISGGKVLVEENARRVSAPVSTGSKALIDAARALDEESIHPLDIGLKRPSLDDVFISLTGHAAEEKQEEEIIDPRARKRKKK